MRKKLPKILVTGGAGFIGSAFVRLCAQKKQRIVVVDKLTYAGDKKRIAVAQKHVTFYKKDIAQRSKLERIIKKEKPDIIVHFAAETHVDRSIQNARPFIRTEIERNLARRVWGTHGFILASLKSDKQYHEAIAILRDPVRYRKSMNLVMASE